MTVIDDYIAAIADPAIRARLEALRAVIRDEAPQGEEVLSYRLPTIDVHGRHLVHFGAFERHIGFYPTPQGLDAVEAELASWARSKGAVQFPHDRPLPLDLVRKIVRIRLQQVEAARKPRKRTRADAPPPPRTE